MLGYAATELVNSNMEIYLMMLRVASECVEHQCSNVVWSSASAQLHVECTQFRPIRGLPGKQIVICNSFTKLWQLMTVAIGSLWESLYSVGWDLQLSTWSQNKIKMKLTVSTNEIVGLVANDQSEAWKVWDWGPLRMTRLGGWLSCGWTAVISIDNPE